ncbi:MAG: hypothetical protein D6805_00575 [Planctomycetota bacterium]|nr:MAG: hypothetical protein D6805_00575 [Planctomycetota bacterium]
MIEPISDVLPQTPASQHKTPLQKGDLLLDINNQPVNASHNLYQPLEGTVGQKILLTIQRKNQTLELLLTPTSLPQIEKTLYREWVKNNRKLVEKQTQNQVGYIHLPAMGWRNAEEFEQQLYTIGKDKKALILDVRYNTGGWVADYLLAMLMVKRHAYTIGRGGQKGYPQGRLPLYAWTKPVVLLCNEYSFSNAEIFTHAFQTLKRGPVVGQPTFGGVISTSNIQLLDGSYFRVPSRGWYVITNNKNMENSPAIPDFPIQNPPGQELQGRDNQLLYAIQKALEQIKQKRP